MKLFLFFFLLSFSISISAQQLSVSGNIQDTTAKEPLQNAVIMAVKLMDSTLVNFTRSDDKGYFKIASLPIDTYQVIISHQKFSDQGYFIFGDTKNLNYDFGKIILQPKNIALDEVTIFAFKDPIYYKGDTLIYTADSFKVKANATVEDLLKKLPGLKVDKDGKITSQGKAVDKVLVDGDEFFGSDPTVATKNLNARSIESVQVYEKKSDDIANSTTGEETQKILNLKLKDDAKKGYFGKVSAASDFEKFHEGELLGNYFKKKLKVSVFGLASNTPRANLGWEDMNKYGIGGGYSMTEDGDYYYDGDYTTTMGIPQTFKTGIYFSDKLSKNTKINANYSFSNNQLNAKTSTNSQYFLPDTSYTSLNTFGSITKKQSHTINIYLEQKLDSLMDFTLSSKLNLNENGIISNNETDFLTTNNIKTRNTSIYNKNNGTGYDITNNLKLLKRFMKKDRLLTLFYNNSLNKNESSGILKTDNYFYSDTTQTFNSINQQKSDFTNNQSHNIGTSFLEPINQKMKIEISYDYTHFKGLQNKKSLNNIGGEYTLLDSSLTNNFINTKQTHRGGVKYIYEIKKIRFTIGSKVRNVVVDNNNIFTQQRIIQNYNNVLPFSTFRYKFTDSKQLGFSYTTSSIYPTISQLQPVRDNTDPNYITVGNPNLLPTFSHKLNFNFNSWKSVTGSYTWFGMNYIYTNNDIVTSLSYDTIGRTLSKSINVNGNYYLDGYVGTSIPVFSKKLEIGPNANASFSNNKSYVNNIENISKDLKSNLGLELRLNLDDFNASLSGYTEYNVVSSALNTQSNKPYTAQGLTGRFSVTLPKKFLLESDAAYTINAKRSNGYNINFLVWNASLAKTFLKNENLIVAFYAYDMLNQNISVSRNITSNIITDTKTNIISRYFLCKVTFKINSNKTKENDEF